MFIKWHFEVQTFYLIRLQILRDDNGISSSIGIYSCTNLVQLLLGLDDLVKSTVLFVYFFSSLINSLMTSSVRNLDVRHAFHR